MYQLTSTDSAYRRDPSSGEFQPAVRAQQKRKRMLGAYYTPEPLARVLAEWAIAGQGGAVLDPSYGGCAFVRAAISVLSELRVPNPKRFVFGVDVDPKCEQHAFDLLPQKNYVTKDFLGVSPQDLPGFPFRAVIGNPPYIRHHWLKGKRKAAAFSSAELSCASLPARASTWAYFVLHAIQCLGPEGRLAFLVPEAILQTEYGAVVREHLQRRFAATRLIRIQQKVFLDTDERVVVIAAKGYGPGQITVTTAESVKQLELLLEGPETSTSWTGNCHHLQQDISSLYQSLIARPEVRFLGEIAKIRIGFVTGANSFFIRSKEEVLDLGILPSACIPIVGSTRWFKGLTFTKADHRSQVAMGRKAFLIRPQVGAPHTPGIRAWLRKGKESLVDQAHKCSIRDPWYQVPLIKLPDAFASCTRSGPPLLILNEGRFQCSNAVHALYWHENPRISPEQVLIGSLTALAVLGAEIEGRRYGNGILKMEPSAIKKLPIPLVTGASGVFEKIDSLLRAGREEEARDLADQTVLIDGLGLSRQAVNQLKRAIAQFRTQRIPL